MRTITKDQWYKMLDRNCNRGKHRLRTNKWGNTFCVICGHLSNGGVMADDLQEDDKLLIVNDNGI